MDEAIAAVGPLTPPLTSTSTNIMSDSSQVSGSGDGGGAITRLDIAPPSIGSAPTSDGDGDTLSASEDNATTSNPNLLPLILGPTLAVFVLAALFGVWCYFYRRRRAKRVAPSAEFTRYQRTPIPLTDVEGGGVGSVRGMRSIDNRPASYALQNNMNMGEEADGDAPPAFTPGLFKDPIFEKGVAITLANQSGTWSARHGHGHGHESGTATTGMVAGMDVDVHTERQDSLPFAGGDDSPASLSYLAQGQGQLERQRLIPPEERD